MTETRSDEGAYMLGLYVVNSNDGWRIKRDTPGPFWILVVCWGFVFLSVLYDVQDDVLLPSVPSSLCLFSTLHQVPFSQLSQPEFFALISGKFTPVLW